ncbi:MAG: YdeI/OmpD-associated family protein [Myxococcota bacterium]
MAVSDDLPHVQVTSREEWRAWLQAHHHVSGSIWLVTYKKSVRPDRHVTYDDVVEEALCFGWVDGLIRKLDHERSKLLLSPRKKCSTWSRANKLRIARLEASGDLAPAGVAAVERARHDGTWTILDDIEDLVEPPDLKTALDAQPKARQAWDAFPSSPKKAMLWWVKSAKRNDTRIARIAKVVADAAEGKRAKP